MKRVRFNRSCAPYSSGEIAGFDDDKAEMLVDKGMASYVDKEETSFKKRKKRPLGENRQVTTD